MPSCITYETMKHNMFVKYTLTYLAGNIMVNTQFGPTFSNPHFPNRLASNRASKDVKIRLPSPMNHVKIFKGWPPRDDPSKPVQLWFQSFPLGPPKGSTEGLFSFQLPDEVADQGASDIVPTREQLLPPPLRTLHVPEFLPVPPLDGTHLLEPSGAAGPCTHPQLPQHA